MSLGIVFRSQRKHLTFKLGTKRPIGLKCLFITVHAGTESGNAGSKKGNSARHFLFKCLVHSILIVSRTHYTLNDIMGFTRGGLSY